MTIFKLTLYALLIFVSPFIAVNKLSAQGISETQYQSRCGTDERHLYLMEKDPEYKKAFLQYREELRAVIKENRDNPEQRSLRQQYTIPIVIHIIHLGEPVGVGSNISDQQVYDVIQGLNERFSNELGSGVDTEIQFCLASLDPNGNPTTGINRVNGSGVTNYTSDGITFDGTCGADEQAIKNLSRWPTDDYYNIWVVHFICGDNPNGGGVGGYANYPTGGLYAYDGTVIDDGVSYTWLGLAHELGHGLNLPHTFEGDNGGTSCPPNSNCMTQGDEVCDTPPHKSDDCGTTNPCSNTGNWDNSRYNWMSYCDVPNPLGRFTQGQKDRMQATMQIYPRNQLPLSQGCSGDQGICGLPNTELSYFSLPYIQNGFNLTESNLDEYEFGPGCITMRPGPEKIYKITVPPSLPGSATSVQISVAQLGSNELFHIIAYKEDCYVPFSRSSGYSGLIEGVPSVAQGLELVGQFVLETTWYIVIDGNSSDTYYLRMDPVVKDNNCFAQPIACGETYSGSISQPDFNGNVLYQSGTYAPNSCTPDPGDDVYHHVYYPSQANVYEFIPDETGYYTIQVQDNQANFHPDLFQVSGCTGNYALKLGTPVAGGAQEISDQYQAGQSYYFAVDPFFVTQGFGNYAAYGNYTVYVSSDVCGSPCFISATAAPVHAKCGLSNGSVNLTVADGTGPFTYNWSNGATTEDLVNVGAGTYTVTITDSEACTATASATVQQQNGPTISSLTATSANCGLSDGSITMNVTGGTGTLTYLWSPGGYTTKNISNVPAGTYTVTVTDGNACTKTASKVVESIAGPDISAVTATNSSCQQSNGKLVITAGGGTGPYTYSIDGTNYVSSNTFTGLAAGSYTVYVKDSKGCIDTQTASVDSDNAADITAITSIDANCGQSNGSLTIIAVGGTSPYQYSIDGINYSTSNPITGLAAGTYTVYVKDANGCINTETATVDSENAANITTVTTTNAGCDQSNGSVTITAVGGTSPYQYSVDGVNYVSSNTISGLAAGPYTVYVKDANNCISSKTLTIGQTEGPTVQITKNINTLTANVTGGTAPFTYQWYWNGTKLSGETSSSLAATAGGIYTLEVKDASGCTTTEAINLVFTATNALSAKVKIYPNPAHSMLYIDFGAHNISDATIMLLDMGGKIVSSPGNISAVNNRLPVDVSALIPGSYILRIITKGEMYSKFIVKQ